MLFHSCSNLALVFSACFWFSYTLNLASALISRDSQGGSGAVEFDSSIPSAKVAPTELYRDGWTASADSFEPGSEPQRALDGAGGTWWESQHTPTLFRLPHTLTIDMKSPRSLNGVTYVPRQDGSNSGNIAQHRIETSLDGKKWRPVGSGTYKNSQSRKTTLFPSTIARYVRLVAQSEVAGNQFVTVGEIKILSAPDPFLPRNAWHVAADSENPLPNGHPASAAIDGATTTYWQTQFDGGNPKFPHAFTIDQGISTAVSGLAYFARPANASGRIGQFSVQSSTDGKVWRTLATGSWPDTADPKVTQFAVVSARFFRLTCLSEAGKRGPWCNAAEINLLDGRKAFADFTGTADSEETTVPDGNGHAAHALDGDSTTFWTTAWNTKSPPDFPHRFIIDMQTAINVQGLNYTPRQDSPKGSIGQHTIEISLDNQKWTKVASGTFADDRSSKIVDWVGAISRYIRITALSEAGGRGPWASAAEIKPIFASTYTRPSPLQGHWSSVINFPVVPVAAALIPENGKVLTWSARAPDAYGAPGGKTFTATYDPATGTVSQDIVSNTKHDMFCPGVSLSTSGSIVVSGGQDAAQVSVYSRGAWSATPRLNVPRGYNSQVTLSNGMIFTIGGSWSGARGGKDAEVLNPVSKKWTKYPGCKVAPMLTKDSGGVYRQDNHGWLFARSNGSVFQAGPSSKMNWYTTSGKGGATLSAGTRAADLDSMNGNAVMYDAVAGKILTVGGSLGYTDSTASANAHIVTVGSRPGSKPIVQRIPNMAYTRAFHNSVILPNGQVIIIGGLSFARVFNDDTSVLYPELFDPKTLKFTKLAPMTVPRNYHSVALLLPDGTIFSGGGGLCGASCAVNHFDAQILTPPYLLDGAGKPAARPQIVDTSPTTNVGIGRPFTVATNGPVASFSLIRMSSVTHSVNTDQRRVPLKLVGRKGNLYQLITPDDTGILIPGSWMLFAMDGKGVPSMGRTMNFV